MKWTSVCSMRCAALRVATSSVAAPPHRHELYGLSFRTTGSWTAHVFISIPETTSPHTVTGGCSHAGDAYDPRSSAWSAFNERHDNAGTVEAVSLDASTPCVGG